MCKHSSLHPIPSAPISNQDVLTDQTLREVAHGRPEWALGHFSQADLLFLGTILQDMAGELLAHRLHDACNVVTA